MSTAIVFFLLFIMPFIIAPFGITQFENPKVIVCEVAIIILFLIGLFKRSGGNLKIKTSLLVGGVLILTFIDLIFFKTQFAFFGNGIRLQGIFLLWLMLLFGYLSAGDNLANVPWFAYICILIMECIGLIILPTNESNRYVGTLGEPNATAAFVVFVWPFAFYAMKKFGIVEHAGTVILTAAVTLILILTNSRSAVIAFAIQLILITLLKLRTGFSTKAILLFCFFLYAASHLLPFFDHTLFENRVQIWQSAIFANKNNIFLGNGFGNISGALHASAHNLGLLIQYNYVDSAHNIFLDWWVQGGIIGLVLLLMLIYLSFKKFISEHQERELVLLFGLLTVLSFNPASIASLLGFWWVIGKGIT